MKMVPAKPYSYEGGPRAVLLLHGFTGNTVDVRELGRYLNEKGYTCHGPLYEGHGDTPEKLVTGSAEIWWENVKEGYRFLKQQGHEEIAVIGLSLGGVFALKTACMFPVKGVVSMSAPIERKNTEDLMRHVDLFTKRYKKIVRIPEDEAEQEWKQLMPQAEKMVKTVQREIEEIGERIDEITCPALVVQSGKDHPVNLHSAKILYEKLPTEQKSLIWYEQSPHLVTRGPEKTQLHEDIYRFLEGLDWQSTN